MKQKITDIKTKQDNDSNCRIYLDDSPSAEIPSILVEKLGLRVGLEIEADVIDKLVAADEEMRAKKYALDLLQENIYSKRQMTYQLTREGFREKTVEIIITELINSGHIRDRLYAEKWVQRRLKSNPRGRILLKQELIEKGVDRETAEQVVAKVKVEDEAKLAFSIAEKRVKQYKRFTRDVARRRLHGYLARRGFELETIIRVIDQVL